MTIFCQIKLIGSGSELWSRISDKTIRVRADLDSQFWSICIPKNSPFEALIKFKIPQKLPNGINLVPWQDPVARLACRKQPLRPVLQYRSDFDRLRYTLATTMTAHVQYLDRTLSQDWRVENNCCDDRPQRRVGPLCGSEKQLNKKIK